MSATTIVHALLSAAPAVAALVSDRIYPTMLPENVAAPAIVHEEISTIDLPPISAASAYIVRRSRVQINALAPTFTAAAAVLEAAMAALLFQAGTIGSESVVVILREGSGPNGFDTDLNLHHHVADVMVTWRDFDPAPTPRPHPPIEGVSAMPQASGVFKQVAYKVESSYGVKPAASAAQSLRRVSSDLSLAKESYASDEIATHMQTSDFRHGVRSVAGSIQGQLSPKTYADFIAAALRRDFAAVTASAGVSLTIAGSGPTYTVTRAAGDWLAANGVKKGDVIRLSAGTLAAGNINRNLHVLNATNLVLTVRPLNYLSHASNGMVAEGPITGCTITVQGKKTYAPVSGHTNKSFSIEHWFSDTGVEESEVFTGCYCTQVGIQLPPTGMATIGMQFMGKDVETAGAQYFTAPTAATTTGLLAAVNGVIAFGGTALANVTGLTMQIDSSRTGDAVVGSNSKPTLFPGRIAVTGQFTAYFEDATMRDAFFNETELDLAAAFTADNSNTADFVAFYLPRIKLGGASKNDGEGGIVQTFPFTALLPTTGGAGVAWEQSTIAIQDSQA